MITFKMGGNQSQEKAEDVKKRLQKKCEEKTIQELADAKDKDKFISDLDLKQLAQISFKLKNACKEIQDRDTLQNKVDTRRQILSVESLPTKEREFYERLKAKCIPHPHIQGRFIEKDLSGADTYEIFHQCGEYYHDDVATKQLTQDNANKYTIYR